MRAELSSWVYPHAIAMIACTLPAILLQSLTPVIIVAAISFLILFGRYRQVWRQTGLFGGPANQVTLLRLLLLTSVLVFQDHLSSGVFISGIVIVMIADGIDGYIARRLNVASEFGEVFDAEVDAFMALALTVVLWLDHSAAIWLLLAGLLRYMFAIAYRLLKWTGKRPAMPEAKVYAVIFFITLLVPWVLDWEQSKWVTGTGCILVGYSFVKEFFLMLDLHVVNKKRG